MRKTIFASKPQQSVHLNTLAEGSSDILCSIKSVFPFDFFPTTITISKTKIDVIDQLFFFSKKIDSILISDIGRVEVITGLFFSSILIRAKTIDKLLIDVSYLNQSDAIKAQSVIQGLLIAKADKLDVMPMNIQEVESGVRIAGQPFE
jgi:hypothetical protein